MTQAGLEVAFGPLGWPVRRWAVHDITAAGDREQLSELLDEGSMRAGLLLTRRAAATGDLRELHRISDAGCDQAGNELDRLLKAPADGHRD